MTLPVWLDLSRLLWRAHHTTPTGIDRVEMAYARHFLDHEQRQTRFVARAGALGARELDSEALRRFLDILDQSWRKPERDNHLASAGLLLGKSRRAPPPGKAITIIPSHQNWHRRSWLEQRRGSEGRLLLFLHDLIPMQYPEYAREGGARRHEQRIGNALGTADAFIVNSQATADALNEAADEADAPPPRSVVAPLGTERSEPDLAASLPQSPYFLTVGTIEPRKNHMLLLLLWRQMAEAGIKDLPRLVVAGRRGWENEQVVDLLQRSRALRDLVIERNDLGDGERASLMAGACALLMPSFSEGFGMPVNEALAMGVPVIASHLPVFAETAGNIPLYCDPLDGRAWQDAILAYARPGSPERQAQLQRLHGWVPPCWDDHFARVDQLLESLD